MELRKRVTQASIATTALGIVERDGIEALSMRTLATALNIKAPSLYDHVKNRDEVVALVQSLGLRDFGTGFEQAGDSIRAKITFYRSWALANPKLYPVVFQQRLLRELITPGLEHEVLSSVIAASGGSHIRARIVWAQLHGLVDLELQGRFPADADLDEAWEYTITGFEQTQ